MNTILQEINDFETDLIEVVKGYTFNQKDLLDKIYLYYNSKYKSGDTDTEGFKKYFYNIVRNPCNVASKAIDFDTKDIRILTAGGGNTLDTWFFERDLKFWMKDINFGKDLNRIFHELPIFGSVVIKIIDNKIHFVDLRNFIVEQSADSLKQANYVTEIHNYTVEEFRKAAKAGKWDNVEDTILAFRGSGETHIRVYERYGEYLKGKEYVYGRTLGVSFASEEKNAEQTDYINYILDRVETELPYREFHWEKIPGRWLGIGRVEIILDPQIRMNELSNLKVKSSYWAALRIFQTRDDGIGRNLLTETRNGEVINVDSEIIPVATEERNLHAYTQEEQRWMANRDEMTLSFDVNRGERPPSGTPLGSMQIASAQAGAYFDIIKENIAGEVKMLLFNDIIPGFEKENTKEHILRIAGEDLDKLNALIINNKARQSLFKYVQKNNKLPTQAEYDILKAVAAESVKQGNEQLITIPKAFYKNIKYKIDIVITGESEDTRVQAANLQMALQLYGSNPQIMQDPIGKKVFYKMLEKGGISPMDFEGEQVPQGVPEVAQKRGGGGVARPSFANTPTAGSADTTV